MRCENEDVVTKPRLFFVELITLEGCLLNPMFLWKKKFLVGEEGEKGRERRGH